MKIEDYIIAANDSCLDRIDEELRNHEKVLIDHKNLINAVRSEADVAKWDSEKNKEYCEERLESMQKRLKEVEDTLAVYQFLTFATMIMVWIVAIIKCSS